MPEGSPKNIPGPARVSREQATQLDPQSYPIAERGVKTSKDLASLMSALMSDILTYRVSAEDAKAVVGTAACLLKVVEMQYKYGKEKTDGSKELKLTE